MVAAQRGEREVCILVLHCLVRQRDICSSLSLSGEVKWPISRGGGTGTLLTHSITSVHWSRAAESRRVTQPQHLSERGTLTPDGAGLSPPPPPTPSRPPGLCSAVRSMEAECARPAPVMLPPKNCLPRNYSCIAGLFGSLAAANPRLDDPEEDDYDVMNGTCEPIESPVVDERPRGREIFLKPQQSPNLRRRCKSLPTPTERAKLEVSRSRSPSSQKKVRFADSLGLELISVKHFDDADEPEVPERILAKLHKAPLQLSHLDTKFPRVPAQSVFMELQFSNPGTQRGFEQKVREVRVLLETVQADEFSLSGFVRVLNLAFEKSVSLRYSLNNWITFMDSLASYVPESSAAGDTDQFRFKIVTPTYLDDGGTLQFAIRYCVGGHVFWDNNNGNNYKVRRHRFKMSPPREWENGWIHFI